MKKSPLFYSNNRMIICPKMIMAFLFCFLSFFIQTALTEGEELLYNGDFEIENEDGMPDGWYTDAYIMEKGYSVFSLVKSDDAAEHGNIVLINNLALNDARYAQDVAVEPDTLYCFSGDIRTEKITDGRGANLSIEGLYVFSQSLYETHDEWTHIEWYGETGPEQYSVTLFARVGGYSGESSGKAWFDNLSLRQADHVPGDEVADRWYNPSKTNIDSEPEETVNESSPFWPKLLLILIIYLAAAWLAASRIKRNKTIFPCRKRNVWFVSGGAVLALAVRILISYYVEGYMIDVNCFLSWGKTMSDYGPVQFYAKTSFCDYPPAYLYILGLNSIVCNLFSITDPHIIRIVFRLIPSVCDIAACIVFYIFSMKRTKEQYQSHLVAFILFMMFNPLLILNSAAWGQMDCVLCVCLLTVAIYAVEGKWEFSLPVYMLAVLIKPQALMLGILGVTAVIQTWIREKNSRKRILTGLLFAAGVMIIIVLPFSINQEPGWLVGKYAGTLASYPYATVNTANIYYLFGGNWSGVNGNSHIVLPVIFSLLCLGYSFFFTKERKQRQEKKLWVEQMICTLFSGWFIFCAASGASWAFVGGGAMAFAFVIVLSLYIRKGDIRMLPFMGALLFILLYVFGVKMHERYIFPAVLLLALSYCIKQDKRILALLAGVTAAAFVNEGIILDNSIRLGSAAGHLNQDTKLLADLIACFNVCIAVFAVVTGVRYDRIKQENASKRYFTLKNTHGDSYLHWTGKDTVWLSIIVLVFSAVSFATLGSTKAPQSLWTSTNYDESVIIDFGEKKENITMLYFAGISRYDFNVSESDDALQWNNTYSAEMKEGQCWKWKYLTHSYEDEYGNKYYRTGDYQNDTVKLSGRYIKITAEQVGLRLYEIIFRDERGKSIPAVIYRRENENSESPLLSDPENLLDEQDTMEGLPNWFAGKDGADAKGNVSSASQPSWWNSTYFDEIYHARTAWEFLNQAVPYETTHPPLGKVLMSWGIAIFGMTPFGWRFAGAVAGAVMLIGIYLIGKQLTKKTFFASFTCALLALDCMHLTQTQIATIDSFPVTFILLAYYFMLRFTQTDLHTWKKGRILADLGMSGMFMGLAIASKWIGIYAGAGLAVLFFRHIVRYILGNRVKDIQLSERQGTDETGMLPSVSHEKSKNDAVRHSVILCLWCVLFFIIIPVLIYLLSYIPYLAYRGNLSLSGFIKEVYQSQINMFVYHSQQGLGMDHPFYSPWYEWPVIGKPMYYASKMYLTDKEYAHSIFCFGNPVIWFTALVSMPLCFVLWLLNQKNPERKHPDHSGKNCMTENSFFFLIIGFLAQYLPWVLVPRGTYIYHYFASVPFLIISVLLLLYQIYLSHERIAVWIGIVYLLIAAFAFVLLFPYASGIMSPVGWLNIGKHLLHIWY